MPGLMCRAGVLRGSCRVRLLMDFGSRSRNSSGSDTMQFIGLVGAEQEILEGLEIPLLRLFLFVPNTLYLGLERTCHYNFILTSFLPLRQRKRLTRDCLRRYHKSYWRPTAYEALTRRMQPLAVHWSDATRMFSGHSRQ